MSFQIQENLKVSFRKGILPIWEKELGITDILMDVKQTRILGIKEEVVSN
jgi:hypothetical protein